MKKLALIFLLIFPFFLVGCEKSVKLEDCISEITKVYFAGETEGLKGNISVGEREEDYIVDGNHTRNVDFSLIALKFEKLLPVNQIEIEIILNTQKSSIILDLNPANHYYMADLGYNLMPEDNIEIHFQNYDLKFENISQNFSVNYHQAIQIAKKELSNQLKDFYKDKDFNGECYLKILTNQDGEAQKLFWAFTVIGKNSLKHNVIISTESGEVILSE